MCECLGYIDDPPAKMCSGCAYWRGQNQVAADEPCANRSRANRPLCHKCYQARSYEVLIDPRAQTPPPHPPHPLQPTPRRRRGRADYATAARSRTPTSQRSLSPSPGRLERMATLIEAGATVADAEVADAATPWRRHNYTCSGCGRERGSCICIQCGTVLCENCATLTAGCQCPDMNDRDYRPLRFCYAFTVSQSPQLPNSEGPPGCQKAQRPSPRPRQRQQRRQQRHRSRSRKQQHQ